MIKYMIQRTFMMYYSIITFSYSFRMILYIFLYLRNSFNGWICNIHWCLFLIWMKDEINKEVMITIEWDGRVQWTVIIKLRIFILLHKVRECYFIKIIRRIHNNINELHIFIIQIRLKYQMIARITWIVLNKLEN